MANVLTTNPIKLDTPAATVLITRLLFVIGIVWDQGASGADDDQAIITDKNTNAFWSQTIQTGSLVPQPFTPSNPVPLAGLIIPTLTHGTVYIYTQESRNG